MKGVGALAIMSLSIPKPGPVDWREHSRDSFPFLHAANRRCISYEDAMKLAATELGLPFNGMCKGEIGTMDITEIRTAVWYELQWRAKVLEAEREQVQAGKP